jgi:REP element-mobilizing transposase RayT
MPRHSRSSRVPSGFLIVATTLNKTPIFTLPAHYRAAEHHLRDALTAHKLKLISYCLMSDRWQLVVGPTDPARVDRFLGRVTRAREAGWFEELHVAVHPLDTAADLLRAARAAERQALRTGLVRRAQDWPWGSLAERLQPRGQLSLVEAPFLASAAWVDFVNTENPEDGRAQGIWLTIRRHPDATQPHRRGAGC